MSQPKGERCLTEPTGSPLNLLPIAEDLAVSVLPLSASSAISAIVQHALQSLAMVRAMSEVMHHIAVRSAARTDGTAGIVRRGVEFWGSKGGSIRPARNKVIIMRFPSKPGSFPVRNIICIFNSSD